MLEALPHNLLLIIAHVAIALHNHYVAITSLLKEILSKHPWFHAILFIIIFLKVSFNIFYIVTNCFPIFKIIISCSMQQPIKFGGEEVSMTGNHFVLLPHFNLTISGILYCNKNVQIKTKEMTSQTVRGLL